MKIASTPIGNVDVESPAPRVLVGQPPSQRGSQDGRNHDAERKNGHRGPTFFRRKAFEQYRLGERLQCPAPGALHCAGDQNHSQTRRRAADKGRNREDHNAGDEEALASESQRKPAAGRQDDGVRDQVAGENPRRLIRGGGETARDMRKRHAGDGGVDHLHERGEHHRDGDEPGIYRGGVIRHADISVCTSFSTSEKAASWTPDRRNRFRIFTRFGNQ